MSMAPVIRQKDRVTIAPASTKPEMEIGDVAAVILPGTEILVIHRIIAENQGQFLVKGDNLWHCDGCCERIHILGYVQNVEKHFSGSCLKIKMEKLCLVFAEHKRLAAFLSRNRIWTFFCRITNKIP